MRLYRYTVSQSESEDDNFMVTSRILITDVQNEDLSTYNCTATNELGSTFALISLNQPQCMYILFQGRIQGVTSHPSPFPEREKLYYKDYHISGYTASQQKGLTMV